MVGKKHTAVDELFKKSVTEREIAEQVREVNIDDFIDTQLNALRIASVSVESRRILVPKYNEKMKSYAIYLTIMRKSANLTIKKTKQFKLEALRFKVEGDQIYRRKSKNVSARRVINDEKSRQRILKDLHDDDEHRRREETYKRIADRY